MELAAVTTYPMSGKRRPFEVKADIIGLVTTKITRTLKDEA